MSTDQALECLTGEEDIIETLAQRHLTSSFLTTAFMRELSGSLLSRLFHNPSLPSGFVTSFTGGRDEKDAKVLRLDLASDFAHLFSGMSKNPLAPFESVHTITNGLPMQHPRNQVLT